MRLLLLMLSRRGEVAEVRWTELDAGLTTWTLPREWAKNKRTHLAPAVRRIIESSPRMAASPFICPATDPGKPYSRFGALKASIVKSLSEAGETIPDWRFHDFRRAGVSSLGAKGVQPHVADRLLNNVTGTIHGVATVYQR